MDSSSSSDTVFIITRDIAVKRDIAFKKGERVARSPIDSTFFYSTSLGQWFVLPDNVVFSHDGIRPLDPGNVRHDFYKALNEAGLKHVSLHSLRHFFASAMLASGCSIKALQHALGHASATMTLNVYSHLIPEGAGVLPV